MTQLILRKTELLNGMKTRRGFQNIILLRHMFSNENDTDFTINSFRVSRTNYLTDVERVTFEVHGVERVKHLKKNE